MCAVFPARLHQARERRGIKREQIALQLGKSFETVKSWERTTKHKEPSYEVLSALAQILGVTVDWLIGASDVEPCWDKEKDADRRRQFSKIAETMMIPNADDDRQMDQCADMDPSESKPGSAQETGPRRSGETQ